MKAFVHVSLAILMTAILVTCKKNTGNSDQGIVGKWQLIQNYNGYLNGGNFEWTNTTSDNSKTLEFLTSGQFKEIRNAGGNMQECSGTYLLKPDNKLDVTSSCQTVTETRSISELSDTTLIIDYQGREGVVREKYTRTQ